MAVSWTPHRFSGGVLALDVTNTVVLRGDPERSFDRFSDPIEIARFAEAATVFRLHELGARALGVADPGKVAGKVIVLRETTDRLFRRAALDGDVDTADLAPFLSACADGLAGHGERVGGKARPFGDPSLPIAFEAAVAVSALSLLPPARSERIRICANCRWLFLDESRNRSRIWCDMTVCGNRRKAQRHYRRRKGLEEYSDA
ncbi:CGNR zinc finger domain-containing protein [Mesorhizobium sp. LHD-90]|uniref:CGNR zinc finger domain-containing protein n=1 Tax=Mesorhizobium sp. LHD-90 TaxID=3071414 RepID=UPI0027DF7511|nr:CGNR zinc finger domain-containing protein [Mesorhizobium sp. LHD-90]MDQ6437291.1 CGNR zinc finger domain-containing protein [Mesorhizobium sp. LHD-90]